MGKGLKNVHVLLVCTGAGRIHRGIESFFREAFDGLKGTEGLQLRLIKGAGRETADEHVVWLLPRTTLMARVLGALTGRNGYVTEQWTSFFSTVSQIRHFRPQVVFYSEANLGFLLFRFRKHIGVPFRLLFSNGSPVRPPFSRTDYVQQVAPLYYQEALEAGEPVQKHFLVPYGITMVSCPVKSAGAARARLRLKLNLPVDKPVVLSVGWINHGHKRMDYVIEEIARLPSPRPYLLLLGALDRESKTIVARGHKLLGREGFSTRSVPYEAVFPYYQAADCFVLASLKEGFGRVYLEALMHGLPVIAHKNPVTEYVLGPYGQLGNLERPGMLACSVAETLNTFRDPEMCQKRWRSVRDRFSWPVLSQKYADMFRASAVGACRSNH